VKQLSAVRPSFPSQINPIARVYANANSIPCFILRSIPLYAPSQKLFPETAQNAYAQLLI
jgi:hypothetical protein